MDPYRGFHRRFLNRRRGLDGALGGVVGGDPLHSSVSQGTTTPAALQNTENGFGTGVLASGPIGPLTNLPLSVFLSSGTLPSAASSAPLTQSPSSSTGSTTTAASSAHTVSSTSSVVSAASVAPIISTTPTPALNPTPTASDTVYASSDGTRIVLITSTLPAASASATSTQAAGFLENPSLEGGVFTLVGIVALIVVFIVVTWTLRKRRRDRLERDLAVAVTFDPGATEHYGGQEDMIEKLSVSSSGHGYGYGHGVQPGYASKAEYHGPVGRGHPVAAYHSFNPAPYRPSSPAVVSQPVGKDGANLTRKFSDRKPVPLILPSPAYDPSNTHISIPPQLLPQ